MVKNISFKTTTKFLGRNGTGQCTGLNLFTYPNPGDTSKEHPSITISPITSKGLAGKCHIEVPIEEVPGLINTLQETIDKYSKE